jgi:hypothetical protein
VAISTPLFHPLCVPDCTSSNHVEGHNNLKEDMALSTTLTAAVGDLTIRMNSVNINGVGVTTPISVKFLRN